ncbi:HlyD family efflux transporter periplasmic adaptor subunit [Marinobacter sp.]|jgi:membrane fusion protein, adhesin transport system|uniref:HlyD family efflux transporter periplasmic adaptor subunit n=1 Tax=Marinobacter sp. TaxID=50741 RepID=UPI003B5267B2|tara:strand:- start:2784 stop:3938 length:1155 start_codon:yes stop_codon:yes gene_type:complete
MSHLDFDTASRFKRSRSVLWACFLCLGVFVAWASWAEVDEMTKGEGRIIPSGRLQAIQSLEGGILRELYVSEGDVVEKGQVLLKLDDTRFRSSYMETREQVNTLKAAIARLEAEVTGAKEVSFPDTPAIPESLINAERKLFNARQAKLEETLSSLKRRSAIVDRQRQLLKPLLKDQAVSEMEYLNLESEVASLEGEYLDVSRKYSEEAYGELASKRGELGRIQQVLLQREDQLKRTDLLSPVRGKVNNISVTSESGVVQPGELIMDILPLDDSLLVETRIEPRDVAFIAQGMPAVVKLTAYDYTVYGSLTGQVLKVGADSTEEQSARGKEVYYKVLVQTDASSLSHRGKTLPMKPGMVAQVEIKTDKRTVLSYLLRPVLKARLN